MHKRWRRPLFVGVSAAVALTVMVASGEVMLPFVLGVVIAYVLTPIVARAERRGVPRGLAVALAYLLVFGSIAGFARLVTPRIALEFRNLRKELPALAHQATNTWVPAVAERLRAVGVAPSSPDEDETPEPAPTSAFVARPLPDG